VDALTLDGSIKEASELISARIEEGTKIAFLNFSSTSARFSEYVINELEANLIDRGELAVTKRKEVEAARDSMGIRIWGSVSDDTLLAAGKMLGAQMVVTGRLVETGETHRIVVLALDVRGSSPAIAAQYRNDVKNDDRVSTLLRVAPKSGRATASAGGQGRGAGGGQPRERAPAEPRPDTPDGWWEFNGGAGYGYAGSSSVIYSGAHRISLLAGGSGYYPINHIFAIGSAAYLGWRYDYLGFVDDEIAELYKYYGISNTLSTFSLGLQPVVRIGYAKRYVDTYLTIDIPLSSPAVTTTVFGIAGRYDGFGCGIEFGGGTSFFVRYFYEMNGSIDIVPAVGIRAGSLINTEYFASVGLDYRF
jgi:hypothetical protein